MNKKTYMSLATICLILCVGLGTIGLYMMDQVKFNGMSLMGLIVVLLGILSLCASLKLFSVGISKAPPEIKQYNAEIKKPKF